MVLDCLCRYYRVYTDPGIPCREESFHDVERRLPIPVEQAALVLVDVWSTHSIESWLRRAAEVTEHRIVPLLQAARQARILIVQAPSPFVAEREHRAGAAPPSPPRGPGDEWPPAVSGSIYH